MNNIPEANGSENGRVLGTSMAYGFMLSELHDRFFIPFSPLSQNYNHENHSVEARIEIWNQIKNSNGETVVKTFTFNDLFP
jgi:hypothetical protein